MNFVGHEIEDFKVNAYHDGETTEVSKKDVLGKWSIFFFYPADFSFVCPTELEALQDKHEDFKKANAEIYSVSEDTEFVHKAWAQASDKIGKIKYPMLADPAGKLARMFDVLDEDAGQAYRESSLLILMVLSNPTQLIIWELVGVLMRSYGHSKLLNLFVNMVTGSAQRTGSQAKIQLSQVLI